MTKTVRDNYTGLEADELDAVEFQIMDRDGGGKGQLWKLEGDMERSYFLREHLAKMVKKPKWQRWVKAKKDSDGKTITAGYWERVEDSS